MGLMRFRKSWQQQDYYLTFELTILTLLLVLLALIAVAMVIFVAVRLFEDVQLGAAFMDKAVVQDTFGGILTVLIVLEFNHSVAVAIKQKTGAIQVRIVVFIAIMVVVRKLMLLDYATVTVQILLGFSALLLALGALQWLLARAEGPRQGAASEAHGMAREGNAAPARPVAAPGE